MGVSQMTKGIAASTGIAIGKTFVLPTWDLDIPDEDINVQDLAAEFERLYDGIKHSKLEIRTMQEEISDTIGSKESDIFAAHLAILDDPVFMEEVRGIIQRQYKAAEVAVKEAMDKFTEMFDLLEDDYMKERAVDIKDVGNRLIRHLLGTPEITLPEDNQPFILVAKELSPSQLAHLNPSNVLGVLTTAGGKTSHSAIMARALGIPMVVGLEAKLERPIKTGDFVVMDGEDGSVFVDPDVEMIELYSERRRKLMEEQQALQEIVNVSAQTRDHLKYDLKVNINSLKELEQAMENKADGVGLFRTEFLYMDRDHLPSEQEQFVVYKQAATRLNGKPLIIRTLDTGGDKKLDYLSYPEEDNPFLGYRAIRITLDQKELMKTQLKAILRASKYGHIKIMYPMISSVEEIRKANQLLNEAKEELSAMGQAFNENIEVGIMVEVPAAAVIADALAQEVDFFSIGTNDLVQYVLAVDRMNEHIAYLYEPYHPAVIRLLEMTVEAAKRHGIGLAVCGEMAGDPKAVPLWIGLGVTKLSMSVKSILKVKKEIIKLSHSDCLQLFEQIKACKTSEEILRLLDPN